MSRNNTNAPQKRRLALKTLGGSAVAGGLIDKLPGVWQRPLVSSAVLPAHAQASYNSSLLFRVERSGVEEFPLILPYTTRTSGDALFGITLYPSDTGVRPAQSAGRFQVLEVMFPAAHAQNNNETFLSVLTQNGAFIPASGEIIVIRVGEVSSTGNIMADCDYPIRVFPGPANEAPMILGGGGALSSINPEDLRRIDALPRQGVNCGTFMIFPGQWADGGGFINGYRLDEERVPGLITTPGPITYRYLWQPTGPDPQNPSATIQYTVEGSFMTVEDRPDVPAIITQSDVTGHVYTVSDPSGLLYTVDLSAQTLTPADGEPTARAFHHVFSFNTNGGVYFEQNEELILPVNFLSMEPPFYGLQYSNSVNTWALHNGGTDPMDLISGADGLDAGPVFTDAPVLPPSQTTAAGTAALPPPVGPTSAPGPAPTSGPTSAPGPTTTAGPTPAPGPTMPPPTTMTPTPAPSTVPPTTMPPPQEVMWEQTAYDIMEPAAGGRSGGRDDADSYTSQIVKLIRSDSQRLPIRINVNASGTHTNVTDFLVPGRSFTTYLDDANFIFATNVTYRPGTGTQYEIAADATEFEIRLYRDNSLETNQTISLTIVSGTGYTLGTPSLTNITLRDNPPPAVTTTAMP